MLLSIKRGNKHKEMFQFRLYLGPKIDGYKPVNVFLMIFMRFYFINFCHFIFVRITNALFAKAGDS